MIIVRSPQRISIGGGGTDLPSYYSKYGASFVSAAINKYVYVSIIKPFKKGIYLKYSDSEKVSKISEINHPIIREVLKKYTNNINQIEVTTLADIPSGTGLGSSGSFTVALIKSLHSYNSIDVTQGELAEKACEIEIDILKEPVGKQDQFIASFGGLKHFEIDKNGSVSVSKLNVTDNIIQNLESNLLLYFTGFTRNASDILKEQDEKTKKENTQMIDQIHFAKEIGLKIKKCLEQGDIDNFGTFMNEHWIEKKKRAPNMTNSQIDNIYNFGIENGALGGKVVGAGGGGFLLFYAKDKNLLKEKMLSIGLQELEFGFDFEGTKQLSI